METMLSFHVVLFFPNAFDRLHCHLQGAKNKRQITMSTTKFSFLLYVKLQILLTLQIN